VVDCDITTGMTHVFLVGGDGGAHAVERAMADVYPTGVLGRHAQVGIDHGGVAKTDNGLLPDRNAFVRNIIQEYAVNLYIEGSFSDVDGVTVGSHEVVDDHVADHPIGHFVVIDAIGVWIIVAGETAVFNVAVTVLDVDQIAQYLGMKATVGDLDA